MEKDVEFLVVASALNDHNNEHEEIMKELCKEMKQIPD